MAHAFHLITPEGEKHCSTGRARQSAPLTYLLESNVVFAYMPNWRIVKASLIELH